MQRCASCENVALRGLRFTQGGALIMCNDIVVIRITVGLTLARILASVLGLSRLRCTSLVCLVFG
jgi:hypothetical protein